MTLLIDYFIDRSIRPYDLFRTFEKSTPQTVSKDHFIMGLKVVYILHTIVKRVCRDYKEHGNAFSILEGKGPFNRRRDAKSGQET